MSAATFLERSSNLGYIKAYSLYQCPSLTYLVVLLVCISYNKHNTDTFVTKL